MEDNFLSTEKFGQAAAVDEAIVAVRSGKLVTAICPICATRLFVTDLPEIGRTIVTCEVGCTNAKMVYEPQRA